MYKNITVWTPDTQKFYFEVGKDCYGNVVSKIFVTNGKLVVVSDKETIEFSGCDFMGSR